MCIVFKITFNGPVAYSVNDVNDVFRQLQTVDRLTICKSLLNRMTSFHGIYNMYNENII